MTNWSASQGDQLMSASQDDACLAASRRAHQQGSNPLFRSNFQMIGGARSWQQQTVVSDRVRVRLEKMESPCRGVVR